MKILCREFRALALLSIFAIMTLLVLSMFLNIFLHPGVIESIDLIWPVDPRLLTFGAYNEFLSGDNLLQLPTYVAYLFPYLLSRIVGIGLAQKITLFGYLIATGLSAASVTVNYISQRTNFLVAISCGLTSALLYGLNPFVLEKLWHVSFLWSYAWFPLAHFMLISSIRRPILRNILLTGLLTFFVTADPYVFFNLVILFALTLIISPCLLQGISVQSSYYRVIKVIMGTSIVTILCSSYWFLPFISNPQVAPYWRLEKTTEDLISFVSSISPSPVDSYSLLLSSVGDSVVTVVAFLCLTALSLPLLLFKRSTLAKSYPELIPLVFGMLLGLFLSAGPSGPSSWFYIVLLKVFPVPWLLKFPGLFLVPVGLAFAIIIPVGIFEATSKALSISKFQIKPKKQIMVILIIPLILSAFYVPVGLHLGSKLEPTSVPPEYFNLTDFLANQYALSPFRTVWLPLGVPQWANPLANKLEYWLSPVPYVSYGFGVYTPGISNITNSLYGALENNQTIINGLIRLLGVYSVKYIVVHNDTLVDFSNKIIHSLNNSSSVQRITENKYYSLYVNRQFCNYVYVPSFIFITNNSSLSYLLGITQGQPANQSGNCFAVVNQENNFLGNSVNGSVPLYKAEHIGVAKWRVQVRNATRPLVIILNEPFSNLWHIKGIKTDLVKHFIANDYVNGWFVNKTGIFSFDIVYVPQTLYETGSYLSGAIFLIVLLVILVGWRRLEATYKRILRGNQI